MNEKLESVRKRIKLLRAALEDESLITEISVEYQRGMGLGLGERLDRAQLVAELNDLELQEARLVGSRPRCVSIGWAR